MLRGRRKALLPEDGEDLRVAVQLVLLFRGEQRDLVSPSQPRAKETTTRWSTCLVSDLDGDTSERGEDYAVALLDADGLDLAVFARCARSDCEDGPLWRGAVGGCGGEVQSGRGLFDDFGALDEDAVEQGGEGLDRLDREGLEAGAGGQFECPSFA